VHGPQKPPRAARPDPIGQCRSDREGCPAGHRSGLPIEAAVIGDLRHEGLGHSRLGGSPPSISRAGVSRLHHHVLTRTAGIFGPGRTTRHGTLRRQLSSRCAVSRDDPCSALLWPQHGKGHGHRHRLPFRRAADARKRPPVHAALSGAAGPLGPRIAAGISASPSPQPARTYFPGRATSDLRQCLGAPSER